MRSTSLLLVCGLAMVLHVPLLAEAQEATARPAENSPPATSPPAPAAVPVSATSSTPTAADVTERVDAHHERAKRHYHAKEYSAAASEWTEAYKLDPSDHITLFNIAHCHRRLGALKESVRYLHQFVSVTQKDEGTDADLDRNRLIATREIEDLNKLIELQEARERERRRPAWKKPAFWGILGSVTAAIGISLGVGLGVGLRDNRPVADFSF